MATNTNELAARVAALETENAELRAFMGDVRQILTTNDHDPFAGLAHARAEERRIDERKARERAVMAMAPAERSDSFVRMSHPERVSLWQSIDEAKRLEFARALDEKAWGLLCTMLGSSAANIAFALAPEDWIEVHTVPGFIVNTMAVNIDPETYERLAQSEVSNLVHVSGFGPRFDGIHLERGQSIRMKRETWATIVACDPEIATKLHGADGGPLSFRREPEIVVRALEGAEALQARLQAHRLTGGELPARAMA
jgi:hypothetical protein